MVSYELSLTTLLAVFLAVTRRLLVVCSGGWVLAPLAGALAVVVVLGETNRTPFDFREGESELISGFNIEFSSSRFVFASLAEYGSLLFLGMLLGALLRL